MWTRSELKEKAKNALHMNYWRAVLAALVLVLSMGSAVAISTEINIPVTVKRAMDDPEGTFNLYFDDDQNEDYQEEEWDDWDDPEQFEFNFDYNDYHSAEPSAENIAGTVFLAYIIVICVIAAAITIALDILVLNPLEAGTKRFMLINLNQPAQIGEIGYPYDINYKNIRNTMFFRDLYTFLWSLLFVVPGIVKSYEYRMIPYILIDNPGMSREEAFARSKQMMQGQKWDAFVLDLSFLGWNLLNALTLGILGVFYVAPYQELTNAALYERLRDEARARQASGWNPQNPNGGWNQQNPNSGWNPNGGWNQQSPDNRWNNPQNRYGSLPNETGKNPVSSSDNDSSTTTTNP